jgi:hypothetical protein
MKLIPTWGTSIKPGKRITLDHAQVTSIDVPNCWAFAAREGIHLPSQGGDAELFNKELIKGQALIHSTPQAANDSINHAYSVMVEALKGAPSWLREGEMDIVDKLALQRRHNVLWFALPPAPSSTPPTDEYIQALDALCAYYGTLLPKKGLRSWAAEDSDPPDTNSGWPLFSNKVTNFIATLGSLRLETRAEWPSAEEWVKATENLANQIGIPGSLFTVAVSRRAGPTRKELAADVTYGDKTANTLIGAYTRTRLVYMVSRIFNVAISPLSQQVKTCRSRIPGFWHAREDRIRQMEAFRAFEASGHVIYESDFSSYDMTFTPQHRAAIYSAFRKYGFAAPCLDLMELADKSWEIVTPSPDAPRLGHAAVYRGPTGLLSGMKETSNLDSLHAQAIVLKYLVRKGLASLADIRKGKWPLFLNLGDDVLLALPKGTNAEDYPTSCAEEGVKAKMLTGNRMLMRHIVGGKDYAVAARVLQQTLANEDSYQHIGHVIVGMAARLYGKVHPSLQQVVRDCLLDTITGPVLTILKETNLDPAKMMARKEVADFLETAAGQSWLITATTLDVRPGNSDLLLLLKDVGIPAPQLMESRSEQLTLLFNQSKPIQSYRTVLGNQITYRGM